MTSFMDEILRGAKVTEMKEVRVTARVVDRNQMLKSCEEKSPLIAAVGGKGRWLRLWNRLMDRGCKHTRG